MNAVKAPNLEPIPGYRLIEPLGSGGFGEVWKCEAPGGLFKAVKFVRGEAEDLHGGDGAARELKALQHVKSLRHPFLLGMDRVEHVEGELVIVMELADRSLHDLLTECRAAGLPGVPRAELLRYLAEAAEALDLLNLEHGLQHLDVKPRNLFLVGRHVKVGDFGLVNSVAELSGSTASAVQMGGATPLYAAPESFLGQITLFSDQYSLAITYHELLAGAPVFTGKNLRQVALQHMQSEPDLSRLPAGDRAAVARALAKEPRRRFPSCTAFVEALQTGQVEAPIGPPPSAPRQPKGATRADIPIVDLTATPVVPIRVQTGKETPPEVARETRVAPANWPQLRPDGPGAGNFVAETTLYCPGLAGPNGGDKDGGDVLAAYQFVECVARNPAGETWTARTSDGRPWLVRLFFGLASGDGTEGERLARLRGLRHPGIEPMEVIGGGDHRLAVVADASAPTLAARLSECQSAGTAGVPRDELLALLGEAAETLDAVLRRDGVRHLGLNPRQMVLRGGRLRLLHYGLTELIHVPGGHSAAALNPRYSAPELFEGRPHASSDLFSLALIFYEMLTGAHPYRAVSSRQMASARQRGHPDLSLAPAPDRAVLEAALQTDPERRPGSCVEFIEALEAGGQPDPARKGSTVCVIPGALPDLTLTPTTQSRMRQAINALVAAAAGDLEVREYKGVRYLLHPGRGLEHQFFARLAPGVGPLRFDGFRQEWRAESLIASGPQLACVAALPGGRWQRLLGRTPGLKVQIEMPASDGSGGMKEVRVRIEPVHCRADAAAQALEEAAPRLLHSLRAHFQALPERRNQARLRFEVQAVVFPVLDERTLGEAIVSQARDISMRGMGLLMPCRPPSMLVQVRLPAEANPDGVDVPACIVRATPQSNGYYEVGLRFLVEEAG